MLEFLVGIIASILGGTMGDRLFRRGQRSADRRRIAQGESRSILRAVSGRVQNIGTEWSGGIAHLVPGGFRFAPTIGIVGDRTIEPLSAEDYGADGDFRVLRITVATGDLLWGIPFEVADEVLAVVAPTRTAR